MLSLQNMLSGHHTRQRARRRQSGSRLLAHRAGAVSVLFATMFIPLLLIIGIAVDFSFYIQVEAQLNLATDSAAMHAVRAAALASQNGATASGNTPNYAVAGMLAGQQWFAAQAEPVPAALLGSGESNGTGTLPAVTVTINYTQPTYTAVVTYTGSVNTIFGRLVGVKSWPVAGTATATLGDNYVDIGILIDNSQSMLIGATQSDINTLELATPCAVVTPTASGAYPGLQMAAYSYYFNGAANPYGQGTYGYSPGQTLPPATPTSQDFCAPGYAAGANPAVAACPYPPTFLQNLVNSKTQACNNGGGVPVPGGPVGGNGNNTPQAPCAFACHQNANGGDLYALARSTTNTTTGKTVQLRLDVVQAAAQQVITTMEQYSPGTQNLLGVGVYTFNTSLTPVYPCTSLTNCTSPFGTNLATAYNDLAICTGTQTSNCLLPPVTGDASNTNFANVLSQTATFLAGTAGNGSSPATAVKNLFIITDGVSDWELTGSTPAPVPASPSINPGGAAQLVGPMDQLGLNPCQQVKNQGITIYVLYTPYYPLPTWTYAYTTMPQPGSAYPAGVTYPSGITLGTFVTEADPTSFPNYNASYPNDTPVAAALRACASTPKDFYVASSPTDINTAMQAMLAAALNSAVRLVH